MNEMIDTFLLLLGVVVIFGIPLVGIAAMFAHKGETGPQNALDAKRQEDNLEIIRLLNEYVEKYPEQRFGQILRNTGVVQDVEVKNTFQPKNETAAIYIDRSLLFEEPCVILERLEKTLAKD